MKKSIYTRFVELENEEVLLYNAFSNGLLKLDQAHANLVKNYLNSLDKKEPIDIPENIKSNLILGNFIIPEKLNEADLINIQLNTRKFDKSILTLTILPTLNCNFRCTYCYESGTSYCVNEPMSKEVQDAILDYVRLNKQREDFKILSINWYGGEPLLEIDTIEYLHKEFVKLGEELNFEVREDGIVTNGYLLTEDISNRLEKIGLNTIQITIDGPEHIHDKRRFLANKKGTFQRIINNVINASRKFAIGIRSNVDTMNIDYMREYIDYIKELKEQTKSNFRIYFSATTPENSGGCHNTTCFTNYEFAEELIKLYKYCLDVGVDFSYYPVYSPTVCAAINYNSVVIEPNGNIHKCWNTIGDDSEAVGNVLDKEEVNENYEIIKWLNYSLNTNCKDCMSCDVLPLCKGGCPDRTLKKGKPVCFEYKYNLEDMIKLNYLSRKQKAQSK